MEQGQEKDDRELVGVGQGEDGEETVGAPEFENGAAGPRVEDQIAVGEHDPLGVAHGARGIDDGRQVFTLDQRQVEPAAAASMAAALGAALPSGPSSPPERP